MNNSQFLMSFTSTRKINDLIANEEYLLANEHTSYFCKFLIISRLSNELIFSSKDILPDGDYVLRTNTVNYKLRKDKQEFYYIHNKEYQHGSNLWLTKNNSTTINILYARRFTRHEAMQILTTSFASAWNCQYIDAIKKAKYRPHTSLEVTKRRKLDETYRLFTTLHT